MHREAGFILFYMPRLRGRKARPSKLMNLTEGDAEILRVTIANTLRLRFECPQSLWPGRVLDT